MKRAPALQPLSREHHTALTLAKACERAVQSHDEEQIAAACLRVLRAFSAELEPHFQLEEQSFLPLLRDGEYGSLERRAREEHQRLRALLDGLRQDDAEALARFGRLLSDHVRFEERELFPALEHLLP